MNFPCSSTYDSSENGSIQGDGFQAIDQLIYIYHQFTSHICTCLDCAGNSSILEILRHIIMHFTHKQTSMKAVYIFLVLKMHWSKYFMMLVGVLYCCMFFRNIKIAKKYKMLQPLKANDVCSSWLRGKAIFKMSSC